MEAKEGGTGGIGGRECENGRQLQLSLGGSLSADPVALSLRREPTLHQLRHPPVLTASAGSYYTPERPCPQSIYVTWRFSPPITYSGPSVPMCPGRPKPAASSPCTPLVPADLIPIPKLCQGTCPTQPGPELVYPMCWSQVRPGFSFVV